MTKRRLVFRKHAAVRMLQRNISESDVESVLAACETIEDYPEDHPFMSRLVLGWCDNRPLHVVTADDPDEDVTYIITVYEPDPDRWSSDFKRRTS